MGGSDNMNHQHIGYNQHPYAHPQQQNLYFQPPQPQYAPQVVYTNEQPVLQASSSLYPNAVPQAVPVHQPIFIQAMPQQSAPVYPTVHQPIVGEQQAEGVQQPRQCRWRCSSAKLKKFFQNLDAYRVCGFLTIMSFVSYFLFTPHAWPWFLLVAAVSIAHCGTKYIKATRTITDAEPRLHVHALWYSSLNIMMLLINLWQGRSYPWSIFSICIWGIGLAIHALKTYMPASNDRTTVIKSRLYTHFIIYVAVVVMVLVAGSRSYRGLPFVAFIILGVWSLFVALHARKVKKMLRETDGEQPAELEVVSDATNVVPQQQNETENAHLVQQQQDVFNSVQQALQEQRAQQNNGQAHLFQSNVYPKAH